MGQAVDDAMPSGGLSSASGRQVVLTKTLKRCNIDQPEDDHVPTVELSCGPATPVRTNTKHCTGLTVSAAQRAARSACGGQRVVRRPSGS